MKELSIEQKAKRYDEAIERARKFATDLPNGRNDRLYHVWDLESIFPELKEESEDEKTKKEIINYLECQSKDEPSRKDTHNKWISYIEKHALSKDDYDFLRNCARVLKIFGYQSYADRLTGLCPALGEEAKAMMATPIIFDESEDEKTRKELLAFAQDRKAKYPNDPKYINIDAWIDWLYKQSVENISNVKSDKEISNEIIEFLELPHPQFVGKRNHEEWIAWLEKQAEQKPAEWTAEDEEELKIALNTLEEAGQYSSAKWLKNVCLVPQTMQEPAWSEEDESNLQGIIDEIKANKNHAPAYDLATYNRFLSWLKSLKERYTWKPSDEQIMVLAKASETYCGKDKGVLYSLYNDLKKLMEE